MKEKKAITLFVSIESKCAIAKVKVWHNWLHLVCLA